MANITETINYDTGVYLISTTDPVQGGPGGIANLAAAALANRTAYLKQHVDNLENGTTIPSTVAPKNSPVFTGDPQVPTAALGDWDSSAANTQFVQNTINGVLSKSVAGSSNVTLTAIEAGNGIWIFTGALNGNIDVIVPGTTKQMLVVNRTTGAYTLRVKTSAGAGVYVAQNKQNELFCDGADVKVASNDFAGLVIDNTATLNASPAKFDATLKLATMDALKTAGFQYAGQSNMGAAGNLTPTQAGQLINLSGTPGAVFLPLANAVPAGTAYALIAQNAGWIISTSGGQYINAGSTTMQTFTLNPGDTAVFESDGSATWVAAGGSVQLPYSSTFKAQLGNLSGVSGNSAGRQLTTADFGSLVADNVSGPAATYTLPVSQSAYLGKTISFLSVNGNGCAVSTSNTETIVVGGPAGGNAVKNIPLRAGETLTVVNTGAGWYAVDGSALLRYSAGFANQQSSTGWQKLPSGIVLQWGGGSMNYTTPGSYQSLPVNLPLTCASLYLVLGTLTSGNSATGAASLSCENYQNWGFTAVYGSNVAQGMSFGYLAICI